MRFTQIFLLFVFIVFISSCQTYHLSTKSLVEQFASSSPEKKTKYLGYFSARLFLFIPFTVTGNDLQAINVLDKKEKEKTLEITSHTGIRITENNGNRTTFYFNTLLLKDSFITGKKSVFLNMNIKPINLNSISKIEIQK